MTSADEAQSIVGRFVTAVAEERADDARQLLHDQLVVSEAGGLPYSGEYLGPRGFFDVMAKMDELFDVALVELVQTLGSDDTVAVRFRLRFTGRATDKSAEVGMVEVYTIRDGLIAELDVYCKDPSAITALLEV